MNYFKEELIERIEEAITEQLKMAMSRNVGSIMNDLEKSIKGDGGSDEPMKVTVKMFFYANGPKRAAVKIDSVAWERKIQGKDDEFDELEINLAQPLLPGMDFDGVTVSVEVEKGVGTNKEE